MRTKELLVPEILSNLHSLYAQSSPEEREKGESWYPSARSAAKRISERTLVPLPTVIGVIAALSPGLRWEKNLEQAESFLLRKGLGTYGVYGRRNTEKARRILGGESPLSVLKGDKVRSFYSAILGEDSLVIDSHAYSAALNKRENRWKVPRIPYGWIAAHYREVAESLGLSGKGFQATIWLTWKRIVSAPSGI